MARRAKKPRKLTKAEQISRMPIEQLVKLGGEAGRKQLEGYLRTLRTGYKRRVQSFARRGLVSHAQLAFESAGAIATKALKKMTRNQIIYEIARYQKFFTDKTSTAEGIKEVNREQDARIFGVDKRGKPRGTMTTEERTRFWMLYNEYINQDKLATSKYGSDNVQQELADMATELGDSDIQLVALFDRLEERLSAKKEEVDVGAKPNVFSGRGPFVAG